MKRAEPATLWLWGQIPQEVDSEVFLGNLLGTPVTVEGHRMGQCEELGGDAVTTKASRLIPGGSSGAGMAHFVLNGAGKLNLGFCAPISD